MLQNKINFFTAFLLIGLIQIIFFLITFDNNFFSDDYPLFIGLKLYNLIQGNLLSLENLLELHNNHFVPVYLFINQFLPDNHIYFHGIVAFFLFLSCLIVYLITFQITNNKILSFLSAFFYSINMSIHIKPYVWNLFHSHIINCFTGLLSVYIFINFIKAQKSQKGFWLSLYILLSILTVLNHETGLVFPIISLSIYILFYKNENFPIVSFCAIIPILIFIILLVFTNKDPLYLVKERFDKSYTERFTRHIQVNEGSYAYFYRSPYANKDLVGYSLRIFDNLTSSVNLYSLENSLKYFINTDKLKNFIINNYIKIISIAFLILFLFIVIFIKNLKSIKFKQPIYKFSLLYFIVFSIFTFIFFRQDLNIALAFASSILISVIIFEFYQNKKYFFSYLIPIVFVGSTFLYALSGFEHVKYWENRSTIKKISNIHNENAINKINNKNIPYYYDYIFLYYYKNFEDNEEYLSKFKNLKYTEFINAIIKEHLNDEH